MIPVPGHIVEVSWLYAHLNQENLLVFDATIPKVGQQWSDIPASGFIPGAMALDLKNDFSDLNSSLPNTLVSPEDFQKKAQALGIQQTSCLVVYDRHGVYSSPRAWWMFKTMGFDNIAVLNGGLPEWISQGHSLVQQPTAPSSVGDFKVNFRDRWFFSKEKLRSHLTAQSVQIIDARAEERFLGRVPEPRKGLRSGHIPTSKNIPFTKVVEGSKLATFETLQQVFNTVLPSDKPAVFSCGSGITASILALAAAYATKNEVAVYDGSWTEWGSDHQLPIA